MTEAKTELSPLSRLGVARLGLVQAGIGAVVVLATSTLARLMTVELALPALVPGALVALHYGVQLLRPRLGHGSDRRGRRTPLILGGMALTAAGAVLAATGVAAWPVLPWVAGALAVGGFVALGLGVGGCGTALLALLAERAAPERRGGAATLTWFMMMVGFIVSAGVAGAALKPYSGLRLVEVTTGVGLAALLLAWLGVAGVEGRAERLGGGAPHPARLPEGTGAPDSQRLQDELLSPSRGEGRMRGAAAAAPRFRQALAAVWAEPHTRRFAAVVFLAMLAYAGQELVLEPLAGAVFGLSPGASTQLMGLQRGGVLLGMAGLGLGSGWARGRLFSLPAAMAAACGAAALALSALGLGALHGPSFPLRPAVFGLGVADGVFAIAAIGAMMAGAAGSEDRAGQGQAGGAQAGGGQAGLRMGVWGAAQALAYAAGGLIATGALQLGRLLGGGAGEAYGLTFAVQALLFAASAVLMARLARTEAAGGATAPPGLASTLAPPSTLANLA